MELAAPAAAEPPALHETWEAYRRVYIQADGRVVDHGHGAVTTSEGQAYAMVRACWMDDRATFELVRAWTRDNLQGGDPAALPAWKWGEGPGGWGVLDPMPAADADEWMAWALLRAGRRWGDTGAVSQARLLLRRIWDEETMETPRGRVLLPGPWARATSPLKLNPSYWLPFAWRDFAVADPDHAWAGLIPVAYELWRGCASRSGLPPDWCHLDARGRAVDPPVETDGDFGFEAFRVGWTLAAERRWYDEPLARRPLRPIERLLHRVERDGHLAGVLTAKGTPRVEWGYPGLYGALLPAWTAHDPDLAATVDATQLRAIRVGDTWGDPGDYYGQNWIWLGYALLGGGAP